MTATSDCSSCSEEHVLLIHLISKNSTESLYKNLSVTETFKLCSTRMAKLAAFVDRFSAPT